MTDLRSRTLDPRLAHYIQQVRKWARAKGASKRHLQSLCGLAAELVAQPLEIPASHLRTPAEGYGRNLLYVDDEHEFAVLAMVWPPSVCGRPHDHGTWGVVAVAEGEIEIVDYRATSLDENGRRVQLTEIERVIGGVGATAYVLPPHRDVHRVGNVSRERRAISIHTYGAEIARCRTFDPLSGEVSWIEPAYHSLPPRNGR